MTTTQAATNAAAKLTNERIIQIADETRTAESRDGDYILPISFARAIESAVLASLAPTGGTSEQQARFAIDGTIQYGRENRNPPPSTDHWLYEYWNIGRQLAKLGETGWDNVTPLASVAPAGLESHVLMPETPTNEMVCAIEAEIDSQLQASGLSSIQMHRQDGADVYAALFAVVERWAASHAGAAAEPAAWMTEDGRVVSGATMAGAKRDGGATLSSLRSYSIPLYTHPATAPSSAAIPAVIREAVEAAFEDRADWRTKIAAAVRALGDAPSSADVRAAGWISVEDRLPSNDEYVWASWIGAGNWNHEAKQGLARYVDELGWQPTQSMGWDWIVTHWMPLPAAPSTNGEKGEAK